MSRRDACAPWGIETRNSCRCSTVIGMVEETPTLRGELKREHDGQFLYQNKVEETPALRGDLKHTNSR